MRFPKNYKMLLNLITFKCNIHTFIIFLHIIYKNEGSLFFMDYEIMMNGNIKIGQHAPDFEATSTMGNICLNDYKGKWVVLFSHPGDFTPVKL